MPHPTYGRLLSFRQAFDYLGMTDRRLRRLVAAKKIPVHRDGRLGFWSADLDAWIEAHRTPACDRPTSRHIELPRADVQTTSLADLMPKKRRLSG